jgi:hypothetical protein
MHDCGLHSVEDMRPFNETRMVARWKLGRALAAVEPNPGKRTDLTSQPRDARLKGLLKTIGLDETVARKAQRIGCMPGEEMARAFEQARSEARLLHYGELIVRARPWWFKENRVANLFGAPSQTSCATQMVRCEPQIAGKVVTTVVASPTSSPSRRRAEV